jgi:predicted nucleic acid-binding protein
VYLDNCCYNRPFDDQSQTRINLETIAKLSIQKLIIDNTIEMVWSDVLAMENHDNPHHERKLAITDFSDYMAYYVEVDDTVVAKSSKILATGIKKVDALHLACAVVAGCDYFITCDDRILKYNGRDIHVVNPIGFIEIRKGREDHDGRDFA